MNKLFQLILLISLTYSGNLSAQDKFEKESRIKQRDIPSKALLFIDSLNYKPKIQWYKEEGLTRKTIEAKVKHNRTKYSIEFDPFGNIEDVEVELNWDEIEANLKDSILSQLKQDCSQYKITKVQRQFTGNESGLFSMLKTGINSDQLVVKYEIVLRCSQQKEVNLFEYLFDSKGVLVARSKVVFKNSSHLEY